METQKKTIENTPTGEELVEALQSLKGKPLPIPEDLMREYIPLPNRFRRKQESTPEDEKHD